jgi:hypothetical protein
MDYARSTPARLHLVRTPPSARVVRKPRTGPMPTVAWRDLERKVSLEDAFPLLILTGFALLGSIQYLLLQ